MSAVVKLKNPVKIPGDAGLITEEVTITPEVAAQWLKANKHNRPVRGRHVEFLASEMTSGNWQMNGQGLVIAENEEILDGQHRLLACIEAGIPFRTMVIYGVDPKAFKTIDTGAPRTGIDALALHRPDLPTYVVKAVGSAVPWCLRLESGFVGMRVKISNTDMLEYVDTHPSLWHCAEMLVRYPADARPMSTAMGTGCYEVMQRKDAIKAEKFMRRLFTGELLETHDVEYLIRTQFMKTAQTTTKLPMEVRMKKVVLGWNWIRRGKGNATVGVITISPNAPAKLMVL